MNVQLGVVSARSTVRNLKELADGQLRVLPYGVFSSFFYLGDVPKEQKKKRRMRKSSFLLPLPLAKGDFLIG